MGFHNNKHGNGEWMLMKMKIMNEKGFTLIEIIATLVLVGVIVALAGAGVARIVEGLVFTKTTAATVQKGQVAATRLVNEFKNISSVAFGTSTTSISYYKKGVTGEQTVKKDGDNLVLSGDTLMDNVTGFQLRYFDSYSSTGQTSWSSSRRVIGFTIKPGGGTNTEFTTRVAPRNL